MTRVTRGEFLGFGATLAGGLGLSRTPLGAFGGDQTPAQTPGADPDLIVVNARVYTSDASLPRAEAFAIKNGRFLAVGSTSDVRNLATSKTQVIDAAQMTITPGFIDCHAHVSGVDELYSVNANVTRVRELQSNLRSKVDQSKPGVWVEAFMFDDTKLDVELTRTQLDEVAPDHPVVVRHRGGHTSWYNSKALGLAGVTKDTPDPEHGRFFRGADGELTGRVAELARNVFRDVGVRETFTPAEQRDRSLNGMKHISGLLKIGRAHV